jgi:AraC-like DNA-binding protein
MSAALVPLFESIPFHAAVAMVTELRAPWGFILPDTHIASLHAALEGSWLLEVPPLAPIVMRPGDIALFPGGQSLHARDCAATPLAPFRPRKPALHLATSGPPWTKFLYGERGALTRTLSAIVPATVSPRVPLFGALPSLVLSRGDGASFDRSIGPVVHQLLEEVELEQPGFVNISRRLIEVLFLKVLRAQVDQGVSAGSVSALGDRRISVALAAIRREVHRDWTVPELARIAGMSRSLFAARFAELVGITPHRYLVRSRMQLAAQLLRSQESTVLAVATRVGYTSESSFSRIFAREMGMPPAAYRKQQCGEAGAE